MNVKLEQLSKHFGSVIAVQHMNAVLKPGIIGLLGANGSGKTTLLRMMVNVLPPDEGHILYGDIDIREKREEYLANIGYMPQHLGMYPTFRVEEFLQYMGAVKGLTKSYTMQRIQELLPAVHLEPQRKKKIRTLSGGMRQRVAIARALANRPDVLLMDEPFGALDAHTRILLQRELLRIWQHHKTTILFVTHGVDEAVYLADRVVVMSARPGTVRAVVPVDIPRPRHRGDPEYARLTASILEMLDTSAGTGRDERKNDAGGCPCR